MKLKAPRTSPSPNTFILDEKNCLPGVRCHVTVWRAGWRDGRAQEIIQNQLTLRGRSCVLEILFVRPDRASDSSFGEHPVCTKH